MATQCILTGLGLHDQSHSVPSWYRYHRGDKAGVEASLDTFLQANWSSFRTCALM